MKLVQKLTLAFLIAVCAVLALNGAARVRREVALFEAHADREHRSVGRALRSSVLAAFRTEGEKRALELVDDATRTHGRIRFRWVWLDTELLLHARARTIEHAPEGQPVTVRDTDDTGEPTRFTYLRATAPDGRAGGLELAESLQDEHAYVKKTVLESAVTTLVLIVACGVTAMIASTWLVGRPVRVLVDKARRVGEGEFSPPIEVRGGDELSELGREMNATCDRLIAARTRIEAETAAKIAALEQLRHAERLSTLGKLASGIAHELGTPINVIAGHADMIVTGEVEGDAAIQSARVIAQSAERVAGIVRQFLNYARRRGPQRAEYDLSQIASHSTELLRPIADKKGITLLVESEGPVRADVDAGQIEQALTNLVMNAIHAVQSGGSVEIICRREDGRPTMRVRDNGPGISARDLPRIFDPFFTTKGAGEGTGLGLSVVHDIVADHGGTIDAVSEPGQGTVFTIRLA